MIQPIAKICSTFLLFSAILCLSTAEGHGQEILQDSTQFAAMSDSIAKNISSTSDAAAVLVKELEKKTFKPNSTRAVLLSFIPGMGQIYNRKYWKLPLVYGGYMGFLYAITWNNKNYQDYWGAYKSIVQDSQEYSRLMTEAGGMDVDYSFSKSWTDFVPTADYKTAVNNTSYHTLFKSRKDFFRRNRDLSIILTAGWFAICMIDAYVDAELFDFDISPSLSMRIEPYIMPTTQFNAVSAGINCSITF